MNFLFTKLLEFLGAVWDWVWGAVESVLQWFGYWLVSMLGDLWGLIQHVAQWFFWQLGTAVQNMAQWLMQKLGHESMPDLSSVMPYINAANQWLPLDYSAGLVATLVATWLALATFRWIKRFVPFFGGA